MNPILPSLYTCIYKFYKFGHPMPVPGRFAGCHRTSGAGSWPVRRMASDVGCRVAGMPLDLGSPVAAGTPPNATSCRRYQSASEAEPPIASGTNRRRISGRRSPPIPITGGCRAADRRRYRSPSDAGPPVATGPIHQAPPIRCRMLCATGPILVCHNLYMWLGNLHF